MKRLLLLGILCTTVALAEDEPPKRVQVDPDAPCGFVFEGKKISHQHLMNAIIPNRFYRAGTVADRSDVRSIEILAAETRGTRHFYQVLVYCFTPQGGDVYSLVFLCDEEKKWAEEFKQFGIHPLNPRLVALGKDVVYKSTEFQRSDIDWPGIAERLKAKEAEEEAAKVRYKEEGARARKAFDEAQIERQNALANQEKADATKSIPQVETELKDVNAVIESERTKYQEAVATINLLTNNKRTPVKEGSDAYWRCQRAANVIRQVESNAASLKAKKAELEGRIQDLKKAGVSPAPSAPMNQ